MNIKLLTSLLFVVALLPGVFAVNEHFYPGDYDAVVHFTLDGSTIESRSSAACTYGELLAAQRQVDTLTFSHAGPGLVNSESDDPLTIQNTGNVPINIKLTAYDLSGVQTPANKLTAASFKAGATLGTSVQLANGVQKNLSISISPAASALANINMWLSMSASAVPQDYVTSTSWILEATA